MPSTAPSPSSASVYCAFVVAGIVLFALIGIELCTRLADATLPDAKQFLEKGGSIETWRIDTYRRLPLYGFVGGGVLGAAVGAGFYAAWRRP